MPPVLRRFKRELAPLIGELKHCHNTDGLRQAASMPHRAEMLYKAPNWAETVALQAAVQYALDFARLCKNAASLAELNEL